MIGRLLLGSILFIALGIAIGYGVRPSAVPPILSLAFTLLAFVSGIFVPLEELPSLVQKIAPYLPMYRLADLSWNAVGAQGSPLAEDILWLVGYSIAFSMLALFVYRRDEQQTFD